VKQDELSINGHAIEARLYAEDPASGFLPSTGKLEYFQLPFSARNETGVVQGDEISPHYDPMIAKIIVHTHDRISAVVTLAKAMDETSVWPVKSNAGFLRRLIMDDDVLVARLDTGHIGRNLYRLSQRPRPTDRSLSEAMGHIARRSVGYDADCDGLMAFRLNAPARERQVMMVDGDVQEFAYQPTAKGELYEHGFAEYEHPFGELMVAYGEVYDIQWPRVDGKGTSGASDGTILSPMPGKIIAVAVAEGDSVAKGDKLVTLEAMKMEHTLTAPFDGIVSSLTATIGAQVSDGAVLVEIAAGGE
jgi:3-methylcrotonyl-CoA carboxylase alpha subunit